MTLPTPAAPPDRYQRLFRTGAQIQEWIERDRHRAMYRPASDGG